MPTCRWAARQRRQTLPAARPQHKSNANLTLSIHLRRRHPAGGERRIQRLAPQQLGLRIIVRVVKRPAAPRTCRRAARQRTATRPAARPAACAPAAAPATWPWGIRPPRPAAKSRASVHGCVGRVRVGGASAPGHVPMLSWLAGSEALQWKCGKLAQCVRESGRR